MCFRRVLFVGNGFERKVKGVMKRLWAHILCFVLAVGVLVVTTPCDCKAVSEALNKMSPVQHETCPFCAKHNAPLVKPVLDQQAVLSNPVLHVASGLTPVFCSAVHYELHLPLAVSRACVQISPPVSPPAVLRI
jgi:hypothetical protein